MLVALTVLTNTLIALNYLDLYLRFRTEKIANLSSFSGEHVTKLHP